LSYDPVQRHLAVEKLVVREGSEGQEKKYYRIRPARWYGGIVTADCVGCGLLCRFCWVSDQVMNRPSEIGKFYSPDEIAHSLITLAKKRSLGQLRVSSGEPTIGKPHLLQLLDRLEGKGYRFILETNGMPIAYDENYAEEISRYDFVHVRVSLKGCNEEESSMLTGAKPEGFNLQLKSLEKLVEANVSCHSSIMASFSQKKNLDALIEKLRRINLKLAREVEIEELIVYPHVMNRIQKYELKYYSAHTPERVPSEQI
jgi:uncharacterized Fe-S cluster-containing radical SAM superfamily protein